MSSDCQKKTYPLNSESIKHTRKNGQAEIENLFLAIYIRKEVSFIPSGRNKGHSVLTY